MNRAPGLPGLHAGAETTRSTLWTSAQVFSAHDYEQNLPATVSWDVGRQQVRFILISQNTTITFPVGPFRGGTYILVIKQDGTGSRTVTLSAQAAGLGTGTWKLPNQATFTATTTASKIDVLTLVFDGNDFLVTNVQNF